MFFSLLFCKDAFRIKTPNDKGVFPPILGNSPSRDFQPISEDCKNPYCVFLLWCGFSSSVTSQSVKIFVFYHHFYSSKITSRNHITNQETYHQLFTQFIRVSLQLRSQGRHQTSKVDISLRDAPLDHFLAISGEEFTVLLDAVVKISHPRAFV